MQYIDQTKLGSTDGRLRDALEKRSEASRMTSLEAQRLSPSAVRPKDYRQLGLVTVEPRIEIEHKRAPAGYTDDPKVVPGQLYIEVRVYSHMKHGHFKRVLLEAPVPGEETVLVAVGACAEACCETYGDPFDPQEAVRKGREVLREEIDAVRSGRRSLA